MDKDRLESAAQLFADAVELPPDEAEEFLVRQADGDDDLLAYARSLLRASHGADEFFDDLSSRLCITAEDDDGVDATEMQRQRFTGTAGERITAYTLSEPLGRGGSGTVWRAERTDGQYEGQVAIKLLGAAAASSDSMARFSDEAQLLARLNHPNIARLLDAGLDALQRPFLVLEIVDGQRIDEYCNTQKLDIRERIQLFVEVLQAVAHAHAHLIVHRDIKPSNVMVDSSGGVKLLDFGIAKLLQPAAEAPGFDVTSEVGGALTPEYASPEQLLGRVVTTASDVYSLGALLYELLTDQNPRQRQSLSSYADLVDAATSEPPKASTVAGNAEMRRLSRDALQRSLRGDLDNMLQKALAADASGRYATAQEFAADLQRYLDGAPVSAVAPTFFYRMRKFVGRHRLGVTTAVLTSLAFVGALGLATQQMLVARAERDAAEYERLRVEASNEFYSLLLEEMGTAHEPLTALGLLDRGADLLRRQYQEDQPFMGRIQFDLSRRYASLPERDREIELLSLAEVAARRSEDDDLLAEVLCTKATTTLEVNAADAEPIATEASQVLGSLDAPSIDTRFYCLRMRARLTEAQGDRAAAIDMLDTSRATLVESNRLSPQGRALLLSDLGLFRYKNGQFAQSLELLGKTLETLEVAGRKRTLTYAKMQTNTAAVLAAVGEFSEAVTIQEEVFARVDAANWSDRRGLLSLRVNYALNLVRLHRGLEAVSMLAGVREDAAKSDDALFTGLADLFLASAHIELGDLAMAEAHLGAAKSVLTDSPGVWENQLVHVDSMRSAIARKRGNHDEARSRLAPWLQQLGYPPLSATSPNLAMLLNGTARAELAAGNYATAETYLTEAIELREPMSRSPDRSAYIGAALVLRARARHAQGKADVAIDDLERAVIALSNGLGADNTETAQARSLLGQYQNAR